MTLQTLIKYPVVFLCGLVVALLVTPLWRRLAPSLGFIDRPGPRKLHSRPVAVGGGVAVFLGFHAACAAMFLIPWNAFSGQITVEWWYRFLPLSVGVLLLGLMDDRYVLRPPVKLAGQVVLALAAYALDIRIQNVLGLQLPEWVDFAGTMLWFLLLMNAFNLIDGIDGLAAGVAVISSVGIGVSLVFRQMPGDVLLFLGFAGACLGFLRYNFYPSSVFLGDTGSLFIGFALAAMTISTSAKGPGVAAIGMPLLAVGVPVFDTILAIWRRSVRRILGGTADGGLRIAIEQGDADHLHHRLLRKGRSHGQVAWLLYGATALLAYAGVLAAVFNDRALGILGLGFIIASYTVFRHLAWIELSDSGEMILRGLSRPVRRNLTLIVYIVLDVAILSLAWLFSRMLIDLQDGVLEPNLKQAWLRSAPMDIAVPFLMLLSFRSYTRLWSLARVSEFASSGAAVVIGGAVACAINLIQVPSGTNPWSVILHYVVMLGLATPGIVGIRAALRVVQDLMCNSDRAVGAARDGRARARLLVWGIGFQTLLYLRQRAVAAARDATTVVVGIVSSDEAARGHYVHGVRVLGTTRDIPALVGSLGIQAIHLVEAVSDDELASIRHALIGTDVRLVQWRIVEDDLPLHNNEEQGG